MKKLLVLPVCLAVLIALAGAAAHAGDVDVTIIAQVEAADMYNRTGQFDLSDSILAPLVVPKFYRTLSPPSRYLVDTLYGWAEFRLLHAHESHEAYLRASVSPAAGQDDWFMRMESAKLDDDFADAARAFDVLTDRWPHFDEVLYERDTEVLEQGFSTLDDGGKTQFAFERYLEEIRWKPISSPFSRDDIWLNYARHLVEAGDTKKAAAVLHRLTMPQVIAAVRADHRFDAIVAADPKTFDAAAAMQRRVAKSRIEAAKTKDLDWQETLAGNLLQQGKFEEGYGVIDTALTQAAQLSPTEKMRIPTFMDNYTQALVLKSFLLFDMGRREEALGLAGAIEAACQCGPGDTNAQMEGRFLVELGRGKEALATLAPVSSKDITIDTQAQVASWRACAAVQAKDRKTLASNLDFLKQHVAYSPEAALRGFLCAGDLDGAAKITVAGLADPEKRTLFLSVLQIYIPPTDFDKTLNARYDALRQRPDVKAAIDKVGRVESYAIVNNGALY